MQNLSQPFSQTSACFGHEGTRKLVKSSSHNWWRIWALGFHQETTEESGTQQNWFCIKLYIILDQTSFILVYTVLENIINITNFSMKFEIQNITFNASTKFKI